MREEMDGRKAWNGGKKTDSGESGAGKSLHKFSMCAVFLLAFLAAFCFWFVQLRTATLQTIMTTNDDFVSYVDTVMDLTNENIRTSAMQMFYNSSVRKLRTANVLEMSEKLLGQRDLGNFASSSFIANVMVYNGNLDVVFTSESGYGSGPSASFHDQDAVSILKNPEKYSYLTPFKRESEYSTYYSFLFSEKGSSGFSSMLLNIDASWYEKELLGAGTEESRIITDSGGNTVIPRKSPMILPDWGLFENAFAENAYSGYILPENSLFPSTCWVYHKLGRTDWYYIEMFRMEDVAPGLVRLRTAIVFLAAAVGILLVGLFLYLTFYVLLPARKLRQRLASANLNGKDQTEMIDELLSNNLAYEAGRKIQELRAGVFPPDMTAPAVIVCADRTAREKLQNILLPAEGAIMAQAEQDIIFVLPACGAKERSRLFEKIEDPGLTRHVFVSLPCSTSRQLCEAFSAIEELKKLAFLYPERPVIGQELIGELNRVSGFNAELVTAMETALKEGDEEEAQAAWDRFLNAIRHDRWQDFSFAIHYADKRLAELSAEYGISPEGRIDRSLNGLMELEEYVDARMKRIANAVWNDKSRQSEMLVVSVWEEIEKLYNDENCCSQMIADRLGVNQSYLSRGFRKAAGMSVNDAIQHVRIERICTLLKDSSLPVEQIARQVGYSNTKYFFVLFKKYVGQTPAQFRRENAAGRTEDPAR